MRLWFWKQRTNSVSIQKRQTSFKQDDQVSILKKSLQDIDQKIFQATKDLLDSQLVHYRAVFSDNRGLINKLKNNFYGSAAKESAAWYRDKLFLLRKDRRVLQTQLEKISGQYWPNKIRKLLFYLLILLISLFAIWIFFMGLLTAIYLLPVWGSIIGIYILIKRSKLKNS